MEEQQRYPVTAETYRPIFRKDVTTTAPNGIETAVASEYCLSEVSAKQLADILVDLSPTIFMSEPYKMQQGGGGITVSHTVPWFRMPSGCEINCGVEANYWTKADGATAEKNCRADIAAAERQYQIEGGSQQP